MANIEQLEKMTVKTRSINNGKPNMLSRVSIKLKKEFLEINKEREEDNLRELSFPKFTELIIRHKDWKDIREDIKNFMLDEEGENE